jgi:hypothetical protein
MGSINMQQENHDNHEHNVSEEPQEFRKTIGSATYVVSVRFSETSRETLEDKLLRLIEREVRESA